MPNELKETTLFEMAEKHRIRGDKALIYRTDILKKYLFPEFDGIKFVPECIVYDQIDRQYKLLVLNKSICICEYQVGGYSSRFESLMLNNTIGFNLYYMQRIDMALDISQRIIYVLKYNAFKWMTGKNSYKYKGNHELLVNMCMPLSFIVYIYYKLKKRKLRI